MWRRIWLTFLALWEVCSLWAQTFTASGVRYERKTDNTVAVVALLDGHYEGHVAIPPQVKHEGRVYDVTAIGMLAFCECTDLQSIAFPSTVTSIGSYAFEQCTGLRQLTFPDALATIGSYAFNECASLEEVHFGRGMKIIGEESFANCLRLRSILIPDSVKTIGHYAFSGCRSLRWVSLGQSLTTIGRYAFHGCVSLAEVTLPAALVWLREGAFQGCHHLQLVCTLSAKPQAITLATFGPQRPLVRIPAGSKAAYEAAEVWNTFSLQEE